MLRDTHLCTVYHRRAKKDGLEGYTTTPLRSVGQMKDGVNYKNLLGFAKTLGTKWVNHLIIHFLVWGSLLTL